MPLWPLTFYSSSSNMTVEGSEWGILYIQCQSIMMARQCQFVVYLHLALDVGSVTKMKVIRG